VGCKVEEFEGFGVPFDERGARTNEAQYVAELEKQDKASEGVRFAGGVQWLIVSNGSVKTWSEAADHIIYQADNYLAGRKGRPVAQPSIPARPRTPLSEWPPQGRRTRAAVTMIRDYIRKVPVTHYYSWTLRQAYHALGPAASGVVRLESDLHVSLSQSEVQIRSRLGAHDLTCRDSVPVTTRVR
jgi:hypothetical protein